MAVMTFSNMDIDASSPTAVDHGSIKLSIHPLAIVNMSDQYTRISLGGSPLAASDPVVGLLFGKMEETNVNKHNNNSNDIPLGHLQIRDAEDIPTDASETAKTQVSLHQAVYPDLQVVGWYRVVDNLNVEPTLQDLQLTQQLQQHYQAPHFVYCVLEAAARSDDDTKPTAKGEAKQDNNNDDDDDLPFTLYTLSNNVLQACENWNLETADAERIAVERVMRETPQQQQQQASLSSSSTSTLKPPENRFQHHAAELSHSLSAIQERVAVLEAFLLKVQEQQQHQQQQPEILAMLPPPPFALLRKVHAVLLQMGPLARSAGTSSSSGAAKPAVPCSIQHLTALCHTVDACQLYVDKYRVVQDANAAAALQRASKNDVMRGRRGYM